MLDTERDRDFDRTEVPYLCEFAMWSIILLAILPLALLGKALALHAGRPETAELFHNVVMAILNIVVGLTVWPMLYVGLEELWHRTPDAIKDVRDNGLRLEVFDNG